MTNKKDDGLFRSSYAIPTENKEKLDLLMRLLKLDSMADLLNMLAGEWEDSRSMLEAIAGRYITNKREKADLARKVRETQRLRSQLEALEGKQS